MEQKKKLFVKMSKICGFAVTAMLFVSCADGFDSNETWGSSTTNAQLESPTLSEANFTTVVNSDGSESVRVQWETVSGAGGYECVATIVDDPQNPEIIYNAVNDRNSFLFEKREDTRYEISVKTLGNAKNNNTGALSATTYEYSTLVPGQVIPAGEDIAKFVASHIYDVNTEQAFELEAGATYTLNSEVDFGMKQVTFRGDKVNRPIVIMDTDAALMTAGGLKVKFINFDCTNSLQKGIIQCSNTQFSELKSDNFTDALPGKAYILKNPIIIQECMFKNVPMGLFYTGKNAWAVEDVRVMDCIVQLDNDGTKFGDAAIIGTYSSESYYEGGQQWNSAVRNITIKNSTLYNIKSNAKNRVIRFMSNAMTRIYTTANGSATIENCTFSKTFTNKEFANNTPNAKEYPITFNNNICYDVFRLSKFIQGNNVENGKVNLATNTIWGVTTGDGVATGEVDATDKARCATEEDPQFEGDVLQVLDLTKPNGGVNFKARGAISSKVGDPRWRD